MTGNVLTLRLSIESVIAWAIRRGLSIDLLRAELLAAADRAPELARSAVYGPHHITVRAIVRAAETFYRLPPGSIAGETRPRRIARARAISYYLARELTAASWPELGRAFNRDHTTVLHGHKTILAEIGSNLETAADVRALLATLRAGIDEGAADAA